jgi:hypothetical protein
MFSGNLFKNRFKYWMGINNQAKSGYYALTDRCAKNVKLFAR